MRVTQNLFNSGELSPLMEGRIDLDQYLASLYRSENMLIDPRGPIRFAPGTIYVYPTKYSDKKSRLIPFIFSEDVAYQLEFGDQYIRFFKNKAIILDGGSPYEISSPYLEDDLNQIYYFQSADVMYLLHKDYPPMKLSRGADTSWTLSEISFQPPALREQGDTPNATLTPQVTTGKSVEFTASAAVFISGDVGRIISAGVGRATITSYNSTTKVTAEILDDFASTDPIASGSWSILASADGNVGLSAVGPVGSIVTLTGTDSAEQSTNLLGIDEDYWMASGAGTAGTYYIINTAPGYSASSPAKVYFNETEATSGTVATLAAGEYAFGNIDALGYNTLYVRLSDDTDPDTKSTAADPNVGYVRRAATITDKAVFRSDDVGKHIKIQNGLIKLTTYKSSKEMTGLVLQEADATTATTAWYLLSEAWTLANGYPSCGTIFEERLILAGSVAYPDTFWGSVTGDYENFTPGVNDDDSIEYTLGGGEINSIFWIDPRKSLIFGTNGSEWVVGSGTTGSPITPTSINVRKERKIGSSRIQPASTDGATLFVKKAGRQIREFAYQWEEDGYSAPDMTLLADHITRSGVVGMAFQEDPFSILWVYLADGSVVFLNYLREQKVVGWGHRTFSGEVESTSTIPGENEDEVWFTVKRTINGSTVRYQEVMSIVFDDSAEEFLSNKGLNAHFLDCGGIYTGVSTNTLSGLDHLDGETISALVDGQVVKGLVVSSGSVTLPINATVIHYGLPYTGIAQLQRKDVVLRNGSTQSFVKNIKDVSILVDRSAAFKVGTAEDDVYPVYDPNRLMSFGSPYPLFSGYLETAYDGGWDKDSRIMIVQDNPLPLTVLAVAFEVELS